MADSTPIRDDNSATVQPSNTTPKEIEVTKDNVHLVSVKFLEAILKAQVRTEKLVEKLINKIEEAEKGNGGSE